MSGEPERRTRQRVERSRGYDLKSGGSARIYLKELYDEDRDKLNFKANLALEEYNKDQGTRLELKKVKKASSMMCTGFLYFITFDAVDPDDHADPIKIFEAEVGGTFKKGRYRVHQIRRPKPTARRA